MYQPPIVNFPVFSVTWSESTNANGSTTPAVLATGGGGAGNTGVGNKISLIAFKGGSGKPSHAIACELETSPETCSCIASDGSGYLMAAAFGKTVRIYASIPAGFHKLADFRADHAEKESGVNSMAFIRRTAGGNGSRDGRGAVLLATGGEDGKLRVWELRTDSSKKYDGDSQDRPPSIQEKLVGECKGHVKPITCVRFHPSANVVLTASKDGTCRLWDWQRNSEAALLTTTAALPTTVKAPLVMCRSCCFSPDNPDLIFSVQSGQRGSAYVTTWRYSIGEADGGGRGLKCTVEPIRVACVSKHPATTLAVRSDGARLAVGNVEGTVLIYRLPGFAKVMEHPAHDLPVTGLGFASGNAGVALGGYDLLAGSADYKITLFKSQGNAVKLASRQTLAFLWSVIVFLVSTVYWLLRQTISLTMTIIPIVGLLALILALVYRPFEFLSIVKQIVMGEELDPGFEDARADSVVA